MPSRHARSLTFIAFIAVVTAVACARTTPDDAAPSGDLVGVEWRLTHVHGDTAVSGPIEAPFIRFTRDDSLRVGGSTGCNSMGGTYEVSGNTLRFGPLITTKRACADSAANAQEVRFVGALERTDGYRIEDGRLVLLAGSEPVARFERGAAR